MKALPLMLAGLAGAAQAGEPISLSCAYDGAEILPFSVTVDEERQKVIEMIPGIDPVESSARITATNVIWADSTGTGMDWVSDLSRVDLTLRTRIRKAGEPERWRQGKCTIPNRQF